MVRHLDGMNLSKCARFGIEKVSLGNLIIFRPRVKSCQKSLRRDGCSLLNLYIPLA
jgi:hypothetical protein